MRLSEQIHIFDIANGWKAIYSPFGHGIAFLFSEVWNNLINCKYHLIDDAIIDYLQDNNILVNDGFEEEWFQQNYRHPTIKFNSMYLVITTSCNFACKYCVVMGNLDDDSNDVKLMNPQTASLAIDFFERHLQDIQPREARVTFYGGEPMLNKQVIVESIPKINAIRYPNQTKPVEIVIITNGYLSALTLIPGNNNGTTDLYRLRRILITENFSANLFGNFSEALFATNLLRK